MPKLTILSGPDRGAEHEFDKSIVIGRGTMADLSFDDPTISRRHAMLSWEHNACFVSDLGSENGTFVNNARVHEPTRLKNGDRLVLGTVIAKFEQEAAGRTASLSDSSVRVIEAVTEGTQVVMTMGTEETGVEHFEESEGRVMLDTMSRRVRFFNDLSRLISETLDEAALLSFLLDQLFELIPQTERAFVMLWDKESESLVPRAARTRSDEATEIAASRTLLDDVTNKREGILVVESELHQKYAKAQSLHAMQIRSAICVPIIGHENFHGVIQVDCSYSGEPFEKADLALMMGIGALIGMFLGYTALHGRLVERELLERDMMLARRIQQHFLPPSAPKLTGYGFAVEYSPALAVGGDFYDFLPLPDGRTGIAVADGSGKGISAALYIAKLSSDLRTCAATRAEPAQILAAVNRALARNAEAGMFATLVLLALNQQTGELVMSSAGHPLPVLRRADGEIVELGEPGDPPLGLYEDASFSQHAHTLVPSETIVLYTDGVTEAEDPERAMFGEDRLREAMGGAKGVAAIETSVLSAVKAFTRGAAQSDDITLLCFGRE